jgi:DNA-directed RNA polymerase specialized sigma24 family protein
MRGFTAEEIARQHGVTETAIRIRLLRARRAARARAERRAVRMQGSREYARDSYGAAA